MINSVKSVANDYNMGNLAVVARLLMIEVVIIPSLLHGAECFASFTKVELRELEKLQGEVVRDLMEVPVTTPYDGLLLELGILTMKARIDYRKLMLYHNLVNSDDRRIAKQLIEEQKKMDRDGTWYSGIQKIMLEYEIEDTAIEELKSSWKKKVKGKIYEKTEAYVRENCQDRSKEDRSRTVLLEEYEPKEYFVQCFTKRSQKNPEK